MTTLVESHQQFVGYLKERSRANATILAYTKDIEQLIKHLQGLGRKQINEVVLEDLQSFMEKLSKENYTPKSISRKTNSTKTFFKFIKTTGIMNIDPSSNLTHPQFENKPPRILSKLEYRALRDVVKGDIRMFAVVELLLQTGIRIAELSALKVEDVDFAGLNIHVPAGEGINERIIPLNGAAAEAVKKYLEIRTKTPNHALFVTKTGKPLLIRNIRTAIDRYFKIAGIKQAKVNDLRHTWVVSQLQGGVSLVTIARLAGHKRLSTTEKYLQFIEGPQNNSAKIELEEL